MKQKIRNQEDYQIELVIKKIEKISKVQGENITRLACQRWANKIREQAKLEREIKAKEKELEQLKKTQMYEKIEEVKK